MGLLQTDFGFPQTFQIIRFHSVLVCFWYESIIDWTSRNSGLDL